MYESRFALGDVALFQPRIGGGDRGAVPCKCVGVTFIEAKVLYDLEFRDADPALPVERVDSIFLVKPK